MEPSPANWETVTAGCNWTSSSKLRPLSGKLTICAVSTTPPTEEVVVSTSGACSVTSTLSATCPICNVKLATACSPTASTMQLRTAVWKPGSETSTSYLPTFIL